MIGDSECSIDVADQVDGEEDEKNVKEEEKKELNDVSEDTVVKLGLKSSDVLLKRQLCSVITHKLVFKLVRILCNYPQTNFSIGLDTISYNAI